MKKSCQINFQLVSSKIWENDFVYVDSKLKVINPEKIKFINEEARKKHLAGYTKICNRRYTLRAISGKRETKLCLSGYPFWKIWKESDGYRPWVTIFGGSGKEPEITKTDSKTKKWEDRLFMARCGVGYEQMLNESLKQVHDWQIMAKVLDRMEKEA